MSETIDKKWIFNDREDGLWNDSGGVGFDTPEEAFKEACDYGYEEGVSIYVGKVKQLTWLELVQSLDISGRLQERVCDIVGEAGEDFMGTVTVDEWRECENQIAETIERWANTQKPAVALPFAVEGVRYMGDAPAEESEATR